MKEKTRGSFKIGHEGQKKDKPPPPKKKKTKQKPHNNTIQKTKI